MQHAQMIWSPPRSQATAVVDGQIKTVCLDDYKGKYLVLYF
jgi:hypothetical protein